MGLLGSLREVFVSFTEVWARLVPLRVILGKQGPRMRMNSFFSHLPLEDKK